MPDTYHVALWGFYHHRFLPDRTYTKYGNLWLVDDRCAGYAGKRTEIGSCECTSLYLVGQQLIGPRPVGQVIHILGKAQQALLISVLDHRYNEVAVRQGCCHTYVDILPNDNVVSVNACV